MREHHMLDVKVRDVLAIAIASHRIVWTPVCEPKGKHGIVTKHFENLNTYRKECEYLICTSLRLGIREGVILSYVKKRGNQCRERNGYTQTVNYRKGREGKIGWGRKEEMMLEIEIR